jgi:hypothetical protein
VTGKPEMRRYMQTMRRLLFHKPTEYALFVFGLRKGLESKELMGITAGQVRDLKPGEDLVLNTVRTGRPKRVRVGEIEVEAIQNLLESRPFGDQEPLFRGSMPDKRRTA